MGKKYITFAGANSVPNNDDATDISLFEVRTLNFKLINDTTKICEFSFPKKSQARCNEMFITK